MKRITEDWDGDLLKIIPQAAEIIAPVADVKLVTFGSVDDRGRLRHPSTWNGYDGSLAFFDFDAEPPTVSKPEEFHTEQPIVRCTALEAFCDAWMHHYVLFIRQKSVWDTFTLRNLMMNLVMDARFSARGQANPLCMSDEARGDAQNVVADRLRDAVRRVEFLKEEI
jgi:hypothetical protein